MEDNVPKFNIPEDHHRVYETKRGWLSMIFINETLKNFSEYDIDIVDEKSDNDNRVVGQVIIVFKDSEDCLAYKLKWGNMV